MDLPSSGAASSGLEKLHKLSRDFFTGAVTDVVRKMLTDDLLNARSLATRHLSGSLEQLIINGDCQVHTCTSLHRIRVHGFRVNHSEPPAAPHLAGVKVVGAGETPALQNAFGHCGAGVQLE